MKNNVIYVDFSKKCKVHKSNLMFANLTKFIKKLFRINSKPNTYHTNLPSDKSKRIL